MTSAIVILFSALAAGPVSDDDGRCPTPPPAAPMTLRPTVNRAPGVPFRFSPDTSQLLIGDRAPKELTDPDALDARGPVTVWQSSTGRLLWTLGEATHGFRHATFTPDNQYIVAQTLTELTVWRLSDRKQVSSYPLDGQQQLYATANHRIITVSYDRTHSVVRPLLGSDAEAAVELPGRYVPLALEGAFALYDRDTVTVYDSDSLEALVALPALPEHPAIQRLAEVEMAGAEGGHPFWRYRRDPDERTLEVRAAHGPLRATGGPDSGIRIENDDTGAVVAELWVGEAIQRRPGVPDPETLPEHPFDRSFTAKAEGPWGPGFFVTRDDAGLEMGWREDPSGTSELQYTRRAGIRMLAFSEDGGTLYAHDFDGTVVSIDTATGYETDRTRWAGGQLRRFTRDDAGYGAITNGGDVLVWSAEGDLEHHHTEAVAIHVVPDAERRPMLKYVPGQPMGIRFDAGTVLAVWRDAEPLEWTLGGEPRFDRPVHIPPDVEGDIRLNSSRRGRFTRYMRRGSNQIWIRDNARGQAVPAILRRGDVAAWLQPDGEVHIALDDQFFDWAPDANGPSPSTLPPPDGVSSDGTVRVWRRSDTELELQVGGDRHHLETEAPITAWDLDASGTTLAAGTTAGVLHRWDPATLVKESRRGHHGPIVALDVSHQGTHVVTADAEGQARVWSRDRPKPVRKATLPGAPTHLAVQDSGEAVLAATPEGLVRSTGRTSEVLVAEGGLHWLGLGPDDAEVLAIWPDGRELRFAADAPTASDPSPAGRVQQIDADPRNRRVAVVDTLGHLVVHDLSRPAKSRWERAPVDVRHVDVSRDGCAYVSTTGGGVVEVRDTAGDRLWAQLALGKRRKGEPSWVVIDGAGRYDGSNRGKVPWLHYVAELPTGLETLGLEELRSYYYQPGLYASLYDPDADVPEPPPFDPFESIHPDIEWTLEERPAHAPLLHIELIRRGGGYGRVSVELDGREVLTNVLPAGIDRDAPSLSFEVDLDDAPGYAPRPDQPNLLGVIAHSASGRLASRGQTRQVKPADADGPAAPPHLWVVAVGTNQYADPRLDLKYAVKDATVFVDTLGLGAREVFADRVHTVVLDNPDRQGILDAFEGLYVQPDDVVVAYFAGHGVVEDGTWLYPTREANTDDWKRPGLRETRTFSGDDLVGYLAEMPAQRRAVVIDTCGAGSFSARLVERSVEALQQQKLVAQLEDRTGTYVLAGSAATATSKEDPLRGHGLLTWSLLHAMETREEWHVDDLFSTALETLDQISGGDQVGYKSATREARSFPLGKSTDAVREALDLRGPEALVVRAQLWQEGGGLDTLNLRQAVDRAVEYEADALSFVDDYSAERGYRIAGAYRSNGGTLRAELDVLDLADDASVGHFVVEGPDGDIPGLARCVARSAEKWIQHRSSRSGSAEPPATVRVGSCAD